MTLSESMVYRVVPKCACSTIGQIMYYSDHGTFFDGDIHDAQDGMHKWAMEDSQPLITANVKAHNSYAFTCVRNPYTRILSSFFDKICGIQRNGKRYRGNLVPMLEKRYAANTTSLVDAADPYAKIEEGSEFDFMPQLGTFETVEELDGEFVRIPGYVVPFDFDSDQSWAEFLFVPYMGACIHTPPPPPNQIVLVRLAKKLVVKD